ncbi:MAG: helix-turn-helix domain-containing protein [Bryobacteraceae bacterium]|jgi:hypothetical protein
MQTIHGRRVLGSTRLLVAFSKNHTLTRGAKLCYLVMAGYGRDSGECYASTSTLAATLHTVKRQVKRWVNELRAAGFIASNRVASKPSHHVFLWHPDFAVAVATWGVANVPEGVSPASPGGVTNVPQMYRNHRRESTSSAGPAVSRQDKESVPQRSKGETAETTTRTFQAVKAEIWGYMTGERKTPVPPPPDAIVRQCVAELHGHSTDELHLFLRQRFLNGYAPGSTSGPRGYAWFPPVIHNQFGR